MTFQNLVCDASPLIVLAKAQLIDILPQLAANIVYPRAVHDEIMNGPEDDPLRIAMDGMSWLRLVDLRGPPIVPSRWRLGNGETEVIEWAIRNSEFVAVIDDKGARAAALSQDVDVTGTLGLIALAATTKIIRSFPDAVERIKRTGFYVEPSIVRMIVRRLREPGEG